MLKERTSPEARSFPLWMPRKSSPSAGGEKFWIMLRRDMRVAEHTSRSTSVHAGQRQRPACATQGTGIHLPEKACLSRQVSSGPLRRSALFVYSHPGVQLQMGRSNKRRAFGAAGNLSRPAGPAPFHKESLSFPDFLLQNDSKYCRITTLCDDFPTVLLYMTGA